MSDRGELRLDLLVFSVCGVYFGVDAGQLTGMAAYDDAQADDLFWFHEELQYGVEQVTYSSPTVITIRTEGAQSYRVIIDSMEEISEYGLSDIRLFPALLEPFAIRKGLWGVLPRPGRMVLLIDFMRLLKERYPK